jgi:hypothetical protein
MKIAHSLTLALKRPRTDGAQTAASFPAYELCLRALPQIHHPSSKQEVEHTFELLAQAMAMDSGYLYAKALYCWAHTTAAGAHRITHQEAQRGLPIALEVLADHRDDPTALAYAGHSVAYIGRRHERGLRALDRALRAVLRSELARAGNAAP